MKKLILVAGILFATSLQAETRLDLAKDQVALATQELLAKGHEMPDPCAGLVRECYTYGQDEFINCLSTSAQHPFCEGTSLGRLASRRWSMTPNTDGARAFTGPAMIDLECLKNFDATFSGALTRGNINQESVEKLDSSLQGCNREVPVDLVRP